MFAFTVVAMNWILALAMGFHHNIPYKAQIAPHFLPTNMTTATFLPQRHFMHMIDPLPNANDIPIIYITDFGGDSTGVNDSTNAFLTAINKALSYGTPNTTMINGVKDLGGVTIDLGGGVYKISKPLLIPSNYGNLRIMDGTICASKDFSPTNEFLLTIGNNINAGNCAGNECNENIAIENMAFDCKHICGGGISLYYTLYTSIGPDIYVTGYNIVGISVFESGGTMINTAYLGEYNPSDANKQKRNSTAIQFYTHDSYISNVIIFDALIGIHIGDSGGNVLNGIHIWGTDAIKNNITNVTNTIGMIIQGNAHQLRVLNCYFDFNHLVIFSPIYSLSVENTFFLGGGGLVFKASSTNSMITGFNLMDSQFTIGKYKQNATTILVDESNGKFSEIKNVVIAGIEIHQSNTNKYYFKTTYTKSVLMQRNSTKWVFDFNDVLLFDNIGIAMIDYSVKIETTSINKFIQYYAIIDEKVDNKTVIIYTDKPCDATIYINVDQSIYDMDPQN
eukprot:155330_1